MKKGFDLLQKLLPPKKVTSESNTLDVSSLLARLNDSGENSGIINPDDLPEDTPVILLPDWEFTPEEARTVVRDNDIIKPKSPQQIEGKVADPTKDSDAETVVGEVIKPRQHIVLKPEDLTNKAIGMRKRPYPKVKRS